MPNNSRVKAQGDSCRDRASSWPGTKAQLGGHSSTPSPRCQQLGPSPAVREEMSRLSSSPPPLARFHWCHCPQMAQLWSLWDHTKPLGCQFQGLGTLHTHTNHAGSCTQIAAPKHRELEAALLSTPEMLSKKLLQYSLHNPLSLCGMPWTMFLRKLEVLPCFTGAEAGCGKGWWAGQRTCLLSPPLLFWIPLLCTPSQYNEQLSLPSWQGNGKISMPWGFFLL